MPSRNSRKSYIPESYYHVYGRGRSKSTIYKDDNDYKVFLSLFKRYLSIKPSKDNYGVYHRHFYKRIELLSYCLMPNHFHALVYQNDDKAMQQLIQCILTCYTKYYNSKYNETGPLLESRYKAVRIDNEDYLEYISKYIHLNPDEWQEYDYSSLVYYLGTIKAEWLNTKRIKSIFKDRKSYFEFLIENNKASDSNFKKTLSSYLAE